MSFSDDRKKEQQARADQIAYELAGSRRSRGIMLAMLALVEADERPTPPVPEPKKVALGARRVLQKTPAQEALW